MRYLDRWCPCRRVVIERQQTVFGKGVDDIGKQVIVLGNRGQFGARRAAAGIFHAFTKRHQAQEHLTRGFLGFPGKFLVERFSALGQRAHCPPDLLIGGLGQGAVVALLKEFGQSVLQQG
jgi:hypothetical protein